MAIPEDADLEMALAVGLGMTVDEACAHVGVSRPTYYAHRDKMPEFFDKWTTKGALLGDKTVAGRITKMKANESAEDRIKALFGRAFAITEKVIEQAEKKGDDITIAEAMEIHQKITVWASKFAAQEAAKLLKFSGTMLHGHVTLSDDTAMALAGLSEHMRSIPSIAGALNGAIEVNAEHQPAP